MGIPEAGLPQDRSVVLSTVGALFCQSDGLSHFPSCAFPAELRPLGVGPSQVGEWGWGPVAWLRGAEGAVPINTAGSGGMRGGGNTPGDRGPPSLGGTLGGIRRV